MRPESKRLAVKTTISTYEVVQTEDAKQEVFRAIRKSEEYRDFAEELIHTAFVLNQATNEDAIETFESLLRPFFGRYREFFDDEDVFEELRDDFVEDEVDDADHVINGVSAVLDGEEPEEVFDSVTQQVSVKQALDL